MNQGKLILIPNLIGDENYEDSINEKIINTITKTNFFIVENIRSARRYIKKVVPEKSIDDITFFSFGKHDDFNLQDDFLQNILSGNDIGLISEAEQYSDAILLLINMIEIDPTWVSWSIRSHSRIVLS